MVGGVATRASSSLGSSWSSADAAGISSAALASDSEFSQLDRLQEILGEILIGALLLVEHSKV